MRMGMTMLLMFAIIGLFYGVLIYIIDYFFPFKKMNLRKHGVESIWEVEGDTDAVALAMTFASDPDAMSMSFQKEYAEPLEWIGKVLRDMTFPFITSKYFYEHGDAFDAHEKKLMAEGVAAFGGIAPTYRIALLDKPTIVWDFHSLLIGLQMMFSFMMAEDKTPLRICDSCDTIFVANCKTQRYCCDKCRRKGEQFPIKQKKRFRTKMYAKPLSAVFFTRTALRRTLRWYFSYRPHEMGAAR